MCDQTEIEYLDGDVVWVKLGSCWWPGEVVGPARLPPDVLPSFRKPPIAVVRFFQETTYEYVKNINCIYKYNCSRKNDFINKGLYMYRTKHGHMEKFPEDVIRAETAVGGDIEILTRDEFQEVKKESYAGIFGDTKKTPVSGKRGRGRRGRPSESSRVSTPIRKSYIEKSDYKAHILVQASTPIRQSTETRSTPSTSRAGSEAAEDKAQAVEKVPPPKTPATPAAPSGTYSCPTCPFTTTRLNVLVLHNKTHSAGFVPYTPSPVRKKASQKSETKNTVKSPKTSKSPKTPRPRKEKSEKNAKSAKKRSAEDIPKSVEVKKPKTEQEIKSSLLADWDDVDEESADESALPPSGSPGVPAGAGSPAAAGAGSPAAAGAGLPVGAESPAVPTPAELPSAHVPVESSLSSEKKSDEPPAEKPESSSDSKYEFCEDEDWPVEADVGRKIPRIKPAKRREETKSASLDDEEVAKEVAELLTKTTVPELPSIPEPLKAEENFPEPPVVKSPDKKPENAAEASSSENTAEAKPTKAIFKTKTFFRSRHSRSQDAIGKYVAEQLNAAERMDINDLEINGAEAVSSPETIRDSSPVEPVKVARLAPKIQLKKMKAEAAQLEEKEKNAIDQQDNSHNITEQISSNNTPKTTDLISANEIKDTDKILQDALYPAQVIKPVNKESPEKRLREDSKDDKILQDALYPAQVIKPVNKESPEKRLREDSKDDKILQDALYPAQVIKPVNKESPEKRLREDSKDRSKIIETVKDTFSEETVAKSGLDVDITLKEDLNHLKELKDSPKSLKKEGTERTIENTTGEEVTNESTSSSDNTHEAELHKESEQDEETTVTIGVDQIIAKTLLKSSPKCPYSSSIPSPTKESSPEVSPIKSLGSPKKSYASKFDKVTSFEKLHESVMSESTASAVDALLSVSREADRVTRIVSNDLPEDLFEDDNKDGTNDDHAMNENASSDNVALRDQIMEHDEGSSQEIDKKLNGQQQSSDSLEYKPEPVLAEKSEIFEPATELSENLVTVPTAENVPSESDLQIAEALINLPSTTMQNKPNEPQDIAEFDTISSDQFVEEQVITTTETDIEENQTYKPEENDIELTSHQKEFSSNDAVNVRYETEQEKSENLNAAQSLVQMSEFFDSKVNSRDSNEVVKSELPKPAFKSKQNNGIDNKIKNTVEQNVALLANENKTESANFKNTKLETTSSKLLKILEEPPAAKSLVNKPTTPVKQLIVTGKEKILNFDVAKTPKGPAPKQKIIIRRSATTKTIINNLKDVMTSPDKIILSRNTVQDGSAVQTFTIQTTPDTSASTITTTDPKQIILHPKMRKVSKPAHKIQKIKPHNSLISDMSEPKSLNEAPAEEPMFDINSMPVVISDDILTPENIDKMPIVMSDGNFMSSAPNPPKLVKTKPAVEKEKVAKSASPSKPEIKTLIMNPASEVNKTTTPNILSKSSKLRGAKPMLVIDKATGKQKIIMTKSEPVVKEIKQTPTLLQAAPQPAPKAEKFILLPSAPAPRPARTQKIVIDPQTGKAHVLVTKEQEIPLPVPENKPVSAKLIPSTSDAASPGNTVMIITNAQGAQSRIVLTPEHEKILFPNKQPNVSQLKTVTHRITTPSGGVQKAVVTSAAPAKQPKIVPKQQKSAIITSKGQLIVGGRVATTAQNIAPLPEIRPAMSKRIIATEPKKLIQAVQKNASEPLIFLQQKSGAVMQLTAAQFEHLQRTGQIVQKPPAPVQENKIVVQKSITIPAKETTPIIKKQSRVRKSMAEATTPAKRAKQEMVMASAAAPPPLAPIVTSTPALAPVAAPAPAPAPAPAAPLPASVPTITITPMVPDVSNTVSVGTTSAYPELDNFEEMLPSTAIARQTEPPAPEPAPAALDATAGGADPAADPAAAAIADNQLLAVPGENLVGGLPGSFYLCIEENGNFTPIDNRPLILENNQLVPMVVEPVPAPAPAPAPERRDILEAALANSDVFRAEARDEAPDFRELNANVSVHCRVSETSTTLNQPIMTPVEVPSKGEGEPAAAARGLEAGLAVIGVTPHAVPTSLELPITVTDPRIAPRTTHPLGGSGYGTALLPSPSPGADVFAASEEARVGGGGGGISMPLLAEEEAVGKSMPLLTDDAAVSSVESAGSPGSGSGSGSQEAEDARWAHPRRLLTPASDTSDNSAEIPLQPPLQLSVADLHHRHS